MFGEGAGALPGGEEGETAMEGGWAMAGGEGAEVFGEGARALPGGEEGGTAMEGGCAVDEGEGAEPEVACPVTLIANFCPNMQCLA